MLFIGSIGLIIGNAISLALHYFPNNSGAANALFGVINFTLGALSGLFASLFHDGTLLPLALIMTLTPLFALGFRLLNPRATL